MGNEIGGWVYKFGGTSLKSGIMIRKAMRILQDRSGCRYVVVSAPGRLDDEGIGVTDMLRRFISEKSGKDGSPESILRLEAMLEEVFDRYRVILRELDARFDLESEFGAIRRLALQASDAWVESRGEYLMAKLMAQMLGWPFVDAVELFAFDSNGFNGPLSYDMVYARLRFEHVAVIPGYYALNIADGSIRLFERGGSDISGAIVARGVGAARYMNGTDVTGALRADPRIVPDAEVIPTMTTKEARLFCATGAKVLHPDSLYPVLERAIPVEIFCTSDPHGPTTVISDSVPRDSRKVTGVTVRRHFSVVTVEKTSQSMDPLSGMMYRFLGVLHELSIPVAHTPSEPDSVSFVIRNDYLDNGNWEKVRLGFEKIGSDLNVWLRPDIALVSVIGDGMVHATGSAAQIFEAASGVDVNIVTIDQGANERLIVIGVDAHDADKMVVAVHDKCIKLKPELAARVA